MDVIVVRNKIYQVGRDGAEASEALGGGRLLMQASGRLACLLETAAWQLVGRSVHSQLAMA